MTPTVAHEYRSAIAPSTVIESSDKPTVICIKWGRKYGADYVHRLGAMVRRHLSRPHRFICLTDDPSGIDSQVLTATLPDSTLEFCWSKLCLFAPGLATPGSSLLYFDLDVVITNGLDELLDYQPELDFVSVLDWNRWWNPQFNSSVMRFVAGAHEDLYTRFREAVAAGHLMKRREWDDYLQSNDKVVHWRRWRRFGSDQEWISKQLRATGKLRERSFPHPWILSYKRHCRSHIPLDCKVVVFHGEPKPHEVCDRHIAAHWR